MVFINNRQLPCGDVHSLNEVPSISVEVVYDKEFAEAHGVVQPKLRIHSSTIRELPLEDLADIGNGLLWARFTLRFQEADISEYRESRLNWFSLVSRIYFVLPDHEDNDEDEEVFWVQVLGGVPIRI